MVWYEGSSMNWEDESDECGSKYILCKEGTLIIKLILLIITIIEITRINAVYLSCF